MTPLTPGPTLADLLHAYEREYLAGKAPSTQRQYRYLFRWFSRELGAIPLANLSPFILRTWRDALRKHYSAGSIRRYFTALSGPLTVAVRDYGWMTRHPLKSVAKPPAPPDRERCLTPEEQTRLLSACQQSGNRHLYLAVVLALSTGARKNELLHRRWADLDLARAILSIPQAKNGERRAVPLVGQALTLLRQRAGEAAVSPWVFPRRDGQRPGFIDAPWVVACRRAGLADLHFHDLRHACASYLAMSGASLRDIAAILGHRSLKQTLKYTHLMDPHTRGVLERMADQFLPH